MSSAVNWHVTCRYAGSNGFGVRRVLELPESLFFERAHESPKQLSTSLHCLWLQPELKKKKKTTAARGQSAAQGCDMMHRHKHTIHTRTQNMYTHWMTQAPDGQLVGLPICSSFVLGASDCVPTVRLALKVKLAAAWYTVHVSLSLPKTQTDTHTTDVMILDADAFHRSCAPISFWS